MSELQKTAIIIGAVVLLLAIIPAPSSAAATQSFQGAPELDKSILGALLEPVLEDISGFNADN
jgi:hypothetical protein